jgi:hypothetical protein
MLVLEPMLATAPQDLETFLLPVRRDHDFDRSDGCPMGTWARRSAPRRVPVVFTGIIVSGSTGEGRKVQNRIEHERSAAEEPWRPDNHIRSVVVSLRRGRVLVAEAPGSLRPRIARRDGSFAPSITILGTPQSAASSIMRLRNTVLPDPEPANTQVCCASDARVTETTSSGVPETI